MRAVASLLFPLAWGAVALSPGCPSRRDALSLIASAPMASFISVSHPEPANAAAEEGAATGHRTSPERAALLSAIASGADDSRVLATIESLVPIDPSGGRGASFSERLDGSWRLLWSAKAEAFSPLLQLPPPLRPDSYQYLGSAAAVEVGSDRVAQGLTGGVLGTSQIWLSSGTRPSADDPSVLDILPPFRLQLGGRPGSGRGKTTIVEAKDDADFRAVNARTVDAQRAPPNKYRQLYVEEGGPGALRISTITDGDPVIVGAVFVHQKI